MCVAQLVLRPPVFLEKDIHEVLSARRSARSVEEFLFLVWEQVWKVLYSWCQLDDAVVVEYK